MPSFKNTVRDFCQCCGGFPGQGMAGCLLCGGDGGRDPFYRARDLDARIAEGKRLAALSPPKNLD